MSRGIVKTPHGEFSFASYGLAKLFASQLRHARRTEGWDWFMSRWGLTSVEDLRKGTILVRG